LQRLFSMFPRGAPGFALILLRISVAASILLSVRSGTHHEAWILASTFVLVTSLAAGLLTPIAALLTIPVYLIETTALSVAPAELLYPILQAVALSLLGPGSCSIDAYLFGRRVVVLPKKNERDAG
jgi:hypothetical protein